LAAPSSVFAAMFRHDMREKRENRVVITDMDENVVEAMLQFICSDKLINLEKLAQELLAAARQGFFNNL
jgi:speckle-type POZ protein